LRNLLSRLLPLILLPVLAFGTANVSGKLTNPSPTDTTIWQNAEAHLDLHNCGSSYPTVAGASLASHQVYAISTTDGTWSGTLYRNDEITCGGVTNTTWWTLTYWSNGREVGPSRDYTCSQATCAFDSMTPIVTYPALPGPSAPAISLQPKLCTFSAAATTWTCVHNFAVQPVEIQLFDLTWHQIFSDTAPTATDPNTATAVFLVAQSGYMLCLYAGNSTLGINNPNYIIGNPTSSQTIVGSGYTFTIQGPLSLGSLFTVSNGTADPAGIAGSIFYRSDLTKLRFYDSAWHSFDGVDSTSTLLNKTLNVGSNSIVQTTPAAGRYLRDNGTSFQPSSVAAAGAGACTNQAVTATVDNAGPTCTTLTSAYVDNTIAKTGADINTSNQVTATHLVAALPVAQGGTALAGGTSGGILGFTAAGVIASSAALAAGQFVLGGGAGATPTTSFSVVPVANGGTNLASGTSGGILGYTASGTLASSVALTANVLTKGGGAGATPTNSSITDDGTKISTAEPLLLTEGACPAGTGSSDLVCADSADHLLHFNPNNAGNQQVPITSSFSSNYTNATTTFSTITNMSWTVAASRTYTLDCKLVYQVSATTAGPKFQLTGPASPTAVVLNAEGGTGAAAYADGSTSTQTTFSNALTTFGTSGATGTNFVVNVSALIVNGVNAGTVALQAAANGAGTLTIIPSFCRLQ
jgi:hypothetical protein